MPLETPWDEIVGYVPGSAQDGPMEPLGANLVPLPMMLCEAIKRGLKEIASNRQPRLVIRGVTYTDPDFFKALSTQADLSKC